MSVWNDTVTKTGSCRCSFQQLLLSGCLLLVGFPSPVPILPWIRLAEIYCPRWRWHHSDISPHHPLDHRPVDTTRPSQVCTSPPSTTNRCTVVYNQPTKPVRFCTFQTSIPVCLCMQLQLAAPVCFMHAPSNNQTVCLCTVSLLDHATGSATQ